MEQKAIKDVGNEFELLMKSSFVNSKMLLFSLDNDKFYIGWVKELPIPSVSGYVRIIPAISGYRDTEKVLVFTSEYLKVYSEFIKKGEIRRIDELNTDLIIDINNILTVSFFDLVLHDKFNAVRNGKNKK
jgi:hypothetical protein